MSAPIAKKPTPQQEAVLAAGPGLLLVTAAAGSGKTTVMTDRIVKRIVDGELDLRRVLVMTFTDAAAANLRKKVAEKLREAAARAPDRGERRRLARQAAFLPHAAISTIHGFCLDVLRTSAHRAVDADGKPLVEPGFRVADAAEAELLRLEALDAVLEARYAAAESEAQEDDRARRSAAFLDLVDAYGNHRGDGPVREIALSIHAFLRSMPAYRTWAVDAMETLRASVGAFGGSEAARLLLVSLLDLLDRAGEAVPAMMDALGEPSCLFLADAAKDAAAKRELRSALETLLRIRSLLSDCGLRAGAVPADLWDRVHREAQALSLRSLPRKSSKTGEAALSFLEAFGERIAEPLHALNGAFGGSDRRKRFTAATRFLFHADADGIGRGMAPVLAPCEALLDLVLDLDEAYAALKRRAGAVDFDDFEHLALAVLEREGEDDSIRGRFQEIYVDEYQDTSGIQEAILLRMLRSGALLVGDVKQSIYRFRHAKPEIFLGKAREFARDVPPGEEASVLPNGVLRELTRNFRSLPPILDAANLVFSKVMRREAGEIDYDASQALVPVRPAPEGGAPPVELVLVDRARVAGDGAAEPAGGEDDGSEDENTEDVGAGSSVAEAGDRRREEAEGRWIASHILALAEEAKARGEEPRFDRIAVLARTRDLAAVFGKALAARGIPVEEEASGEFLESPELRRMEAFVHVLDNPRQDVPLAATMQSPLAPEPFDEEELLRIRVHAAGKGQRRAFYHRAAAAYAEDGPDPALRGKVARFLAWVADLRERAAHASLDALIGHAYRTSGILERVGRLPDGAARVADLRMFHEWAGAFEATRLRGLYGFARYIERMRKTGSGDAVRGARPGGRNAVRVMTLHRSKGLEFPVVFLGGLSHGFNLRDGAESVLVSEPLGLGPDVVDARRRTAYPSHLKLALREHARRAALAEEMRLLYVAMTRAEDRLILVASTASGREGPDARLARIVAEAQAWAGGRVPTYRVLSAANPFEWLLMAYAAERPGAAADLIGADAPAGSRDAAAAEPLAFWTCRRIAASETFGGGVLERPSDEPDGAASPAAEAASAGSPFAASYRFDGATRAPSKVSVSELKRRAAPEPAEGEESDGTGDAAAPEAFLPVEGAAEGAGGDVRRLRLRFGALKSVDLEMRDLPEPADGMRGAARALPPNEVGTAVHSALRYLDLRAAAAAPADGREAEVLRQVARMAELRMLSPEEAEAARGFAPAIAAFAGSGLARRILASEKAGRVFRENPFTLSVPCADLYRSVPDAGAFAPEDRTMVQGIVDLWFVEEGCAVLVDYKTDRIEGSDDAAGETLRRRYGTQMRYYAEAIEAATGRPVAERILWLVRRGKGYPA